MYSPGDLYLFRLRKAVSLRRHLSITHKFSGGGCSEFDIDELHRRPCGVHRDQRLHTLCPWSYFQDLARHPRSIDATLARRPHFSNEGEESPQVYKLAAIGRLVADTYWHCDPLLSDVDRPAWAELTLTQSTHLGRCAPLLRQIGGGAEENLVASAPSNDYPDPGVPRCRWLVIRQPYRPSEKTGQTRSQLHCHGFPSRQRPWNSRPAPASSVSVSSSVPAR